MLILSRKPGEAICIGDDVSIHIIEVKGNQVRIGTRAPKKVGVHRDEVYRRIQQQVIHKLKEDK